MMKQSLILSVLVVTGLLTACEKSDTDAALEQTQNVVRDAAEATKDAASDAAEATKEATGEAMEYTGDKVREAGEAVSEAGKSMQTSE